MAGRPGARPAAAPIRAVFIANRGEIAGRITRTCLRLGIRAIVPETDGPDGLDLLDIGAVVDAARATGADAVHPGFGFLAENADFAEAVIAAGIRWVGPPPDAIRTMGDKAAARQLAASLGVPVLAGYDDPDQSDDALLAAADRVGFPLLVKPAAGGGGKGMRTVRGAETLPDAIAAARREAAAAFGDDRLILERLVVGARHIEIQVLFDQHGNGVSLGERDCSIQRRHQKVLEESPSPAVDEALRARLGEASLTLARSVGYVGAGTCEFLARWPGSLHLPRDEHPSPGRAPGDRARDRPRPRRRPARDRGGTAAPDPGHGGPRRPRGRGPAVCRGCRGRLPARDRPSRGPPLADRRRRPGRCRDRDRHRDQRAVRSDARKDHRLGAGSRDGARASRGCARPNARPRCRDEPAVPALAGPPAGRAWRARPGPTC